MSGYCGGRIIRIRMKRFMAYDDFEFVPKNHLNLILGLNGSGKSTIMCAICLALGGKPQHTGRSSQLSEFIKYGNDDAEVEVELDAMDGKIVTITRVIQIERTIWLKNGMVTSLNEITAILKEFNIDMSNLCQYLPQEKVAEFARMSKCQRLDNMLQAIGDPTLYSLFLELKSLKKSTAEIERTITTHQQKKTSEENRNERLRGEVEKYKEQVRLKKELNELKQKEVIFKYALKIEKRQSIVNQLKKKKDDRANMEEEINCMNSHKSEMESEFSQKINDIKAESDKLKSLLEKIGNNNNLILKCQEKVASCERQLAEKRNLIITLNKLQLEITQLEESHDSLQEENNSNIARDNEISEEIYRLKQNISSLESDIETLKCEMNNCEVLKNEHIQKFTRLNNEDNIKRRNLQTKFPSEYKAVTYFDQIRNSFKSEICYPPLLSLKIKDDTSRKFVENLISFDNLSLFVCVDSQECKRLTDIMRFQEKLCVNIAMAPDKLLSQYPSPEITTKMREFGIIGFLKDHMSAPEPVMRFFCQVYQIHRIPVCTEVAMHHIEEIFKNFRFSLLFTPKHKVTIKQSLYGDRLISIKLDPIRERNILQCSIDNSDQVKVIEKEIKNFQNSIAKLKSSFDEQAEKRQEMIEKLENHTQNRNALSEALKNFRFLTHRLDQKRKTFDEMKGNVIGQIAETKLIEIIQKDIKNKIKYFGIAVQLCDEFVNLKAKKLKIILKVKSEMSSLEKIKQEIIGKESDLNKIIKEMADIDKLLKKVDNECLDMKKKIPETHHSHSVLANIIKNTNMEVVEGNIAHITAQLEVNSDNNEAVSKEFESRRHQIEQIGAIIEGQKLQLQELKDQMQTKKNLWLYPVQAHLANINKNFSNYYKRLDCAGEITLDQSAKEDDFLNYGVSIKLKYRDTDDFTELSQSHHSGGECSVAAIIFILSLQELASVPFRCIDEINQGMDSSNERRIYNLIADSVRAESCSQYFLLTPKLLINLTHHEGLCIHIIYNHFSLRTSLEVRKHLDIEEELKSMDCQ